MYIKRTFNCFLYWKSVYLKSNLIHFLFFHLSRLPLKPRKLHISYSSNNRNSKLMLHNSWGAVPFLRASHTISFLQISFFNLQAQSSSQHRILNANHTFLKLILLAEFFRRFSVAGINIQKTRNIQPKTQKSRRIVIWM